MVKAFFHILRRLVLNLTTFLNELNQGTCLPNILEIGRDHRVKRLLDKALDVAKALNHERGFAIVDMNHD